MNEPNAPRGEIAVVTATPPGLNPGMMAVELGLLAFATRHGFRDSLKFYQLYSLEERLSGIDAEAREAVLRFTTMPAPYRSIREGFGKLLASDGILYWGDFLHMAQYHRTQRRVLANIPVASSLDDAVDLIDRTLMLKGQPGAILRKTVSFGTTLLFNTLSDESSKEYGVSLSEFLAQARRIWVRDVFSAAKVAHLRGDYTTVHWGCDGAQFLKPEDLPQLSAEMGEPMPSGLDSKKRILVFLGRTPQWAPVMFDIARKIAEHRQTSACWIPWGSSSAFPAGGLSLIPDDFERIQDSHVITLLNWVAAADVVVTDTYHLALIAWNFGVPAVALTSPFDAAETNVNSGARFNWRDKREVFFSQYDALDFLLRPEELAEPSHLEARLNRLLHLIDDADHIGRICARIQAHVGAVEEEFKNELQSLLPQQASGKATP